MAIDEDVLCEDDQQKVDEHVEWWREIIRLRDALKEEVAVSGGNNHMSVRSLSRLDAALLGMARANGRRGVDGARWHHEVGQHLEMIHRNGREAFERILQCYQESPSGDISEAFKLLMINRAVRMFVVTVSAWLGKSEREIKAALSADVLTIGLKQGISEGLDYFLGNLVDRHPKTIAKIRREQKPTQSTKDQSRSE
jgi:hypothetical protein